MVGGGAAGIAAAAAGLRRKARTLLVQDGPIGGDCTFTGCVPSKTLLAQAAHRSPFDQAMSAVKATIATIAATESAEVFRGMGLEVADARARFVASRTLEVDGRKIVSDRIVLATGSRPVIPAVDGLSGIDPLTSETVFDLKELPDSLAILGGGSIGCEFAQAFCRLGSHVTLVETRERILHGEEPEASAAIREVFAREGIDVRTDERLRCAERLEDGTARLHLEGGASIDAARVLVTTGTEAAVHDLGLDRAGIETNDAGWIAVDDRLATSAAGVWAAGDATGILPFTHAADEMGRLAAANAFARRGRRFDRRAIGWVTFTDPEVARVGVSEAEAPSAARVAFLPMSEVDRAIVEDRSDGFVKLIAEPRPLLRGFGGGRVAGGTVVAARGGELIHEVALAMRTRMLTGRLAQTVHAYPTWSVAIRQATAQFFGGYGGRKARSVRSGSLS